MNNKKCANTTKYKNIIGYINTIPLSSEICIGDINEVSLSLDRINICLCLEHYNDYLTIVALNLISKIDLLDILYKPRDQKNIMLSKLAIHLNKSIAYILNEAKILDKNYRI